MTREPLAERLAAEIRRDGPIRASRFIAAALYDVDSGFYTKPGIRGRAGRRGDFLTAPEVGPLFGAVIARALDAWWDDAGQPAAWIVRDVGAGPGTLARSIVAARPRCHEAGALQLQLVELSDSQRISHPSDPAIQISAATDATAPPADVVLANELLDNLPFDIAECTRDGWREVLIDGRNGEFVECIGDRLEGFVSPPDAEVGTRLPLHRLAARWIADQRGAAARLVAFDYAASGGVLAGRSGAWLRTFREHRVGADWLADPGSQDITCDLALEQVLAAADKPQVMSQAAFLQTHGVNELVEQGRMLWKAGAATGDLAALKARSRVREAETLLDPDGMGGFTVFEWPPRLMGQTLTAAALHSGP